MKEILPKLALVFPGVGSQHSMMAKSFYDNSKIAKVTFEEASDLLKLDLKEICFLNDYNSELNKTDVSQIALLTACIAIFRVFEQEIGLSADYCLGHSLGECTALCASGMIKFADALEIVKQRGSIIKEVTSSVDGTMMWVINLDNKIVEDICAANSNEVEKVSVSAFDCPTQCSISGNSKVIIKTAQELENRGAIVYPLKMSGPFHCQLMMEASKRIREVLEKYKYNRPKYQVIANHNALPYAGEESVVDNLSKQLVSPIRWQESIQFIVNNGVRIAIELGPKDVLKFLIKKNTPEIRSFSFNDYGLIDNLRKSFIIESEQSLSIIGRCLKIAVSTRNYNSDYETYRNGVVLPYKEIEAMFEELDEKGRHPSKEQLEKAVNMVISVLDNKKVPQELKNVKMQQILEGKVLKL